MVIFRSGDMVLAPSGDKIHRRAIILDLPDPDHARLVFKDNPNREVWAWPHTLVLLSRAAWQELANWRRQVLIARTEACPERTPRAVN